MNINRDEWPVLPIGASLNFYLFATADGIKMIVQLNY